MENKTFENMNIEEHELELEKQRTHMRQMFHDQYAIQVEVLEGGIIPSKKNSKDAGFDVFATSDITIKFGEVIKHPLNIKFKLPLETWARIETKSGLGSKGMLVYAGVIDEEYRGIPHVIATNLIQGTEIIIKKGQKLAQLTMNPHSTHFFIEQVEAVSNDTTRGSSGFGSTGA